MGGCLSYVQLYRYISLDKGRGCKPLEWSVHCPDLTFPIFYFKEKSINLERVIEGELFTVFSLVAVLTASNGRDGGSVCLTVDTLCL